MYSDLSREHQFGRGNHLRKELLLDRERLVDQTDLVIQVGHHHIGCGGQVSGQLSIWLNRHLMCG